MRRRSGAAARRWQPSSRDGRRSECDCQAGVARGWKKNATAWWQSEGRADRLGLTVTVCHYPTGCSKYNPIERRLFSAITSNWAGIPLRSFQTMLKCIRATTTETGLKVKAFLMKRTYAKGQQVTDAEMRTRNLVRDTVCPNWNYTIHPRSASTCGAS